MYPYFKVESYFYPFLLHFCSQGVTFFFLTQMRYQGKSQDRHSKKYCVYINIQRRRDQNFSVGRRKWDKQCIACGATCRHFPSCTRKGCRCVEKALWCIIYNIKRAGSNLDRLMDIIIQQKNVSGYRRRSISDRINYTTPFQKGH